MKELFNYLLFAIILYYILTSIFDNFTLEQENFDPSLVPISSIITLAKVAQKLVNGNAILTNPKNLQIGTSFSAPGNLVVTGTATVGVNQPFSLPNATANNTFILQNDTDSCFRLKDNGGGQLLAITQDGSFYSKNNGIIISNSGNTTLSGSLKVGGNTTVNNLSTTNGGISINNGIINLTSDGSGGLYFLKSGTISNPSYNGVQMGNLTVNGNQIITGNLSVKGNTTLSNDITIKGDTSISGNTSIGGNLTLNGDDISIVLSSQLTPLINKINELETLIPSFDKLSSILKEYNVT